MTKKIIVSGRAYGFGSNKWRGVTHLSTEAKSLLENDDNMVICYRPFGDNRGYWYVVVRKSYRGRTIYDHRLPNEGEAELIRKWEAEE